MKRHRKIRKAVEAALIVATLLFASVRASTTRRYACKNNLKQLGLALHQYATDYDEWFPDTGEDGVRNLDILVRMGYMPDPLVFQCPSSGEKVAYTWSRDDNAYATISDWSRVSYFYNPGVNLEDLGEEDSELAKGTVVMGDKTYEHHHWEGRNVLFGDGHVEWQDAPYLSHFKARERKSNLMYGVSGAVAATALICALSCLRRCLVRREREGT